MASLNRVEIIGHVGRDPEMLLEKKCSKCKISLPLTQFSKGKNKDGLRSACKDCCSADQHSYYYKCDGKVNKDFYYLAHRDALLPKLRLTGDKNPYNPEKQPARIAVFRAVRAGRLIKPTVCSECGASGRIESHHWHGYDFPHRLDVVWLCPLCHSLFENPDFTERLKNYQKELTYA